MPGPVNCNTHMTKILLEIPFNIIYDYNRKAKDQTFHACMKLTDMISQVKYIGTTKNRYRSSGGYEMRGYEMAQILKEQGITVEDVAAEIAYRKETNALSNNPQNEAFNDMTLSQLLRIKEMWDI